MTIRQKIAVWYSTFFLVLMVLLAITIFLTVRYFMYRNAENTMQTNAAKLLVAIDIEHDQMSIDPSTATGCNFTVFNASGEICYDNTGWKDFNYNAKEWDKIVKVTIDGEDLLLLDTQIKDENIVVGHLRVIQSTDQIESAMHTIFILFVLFIPIYIIIVVMGSLSIASAALRPIARVTQTAQQISQLDLSKRIEVQETDDEVGSLIKIFNEMLVNLESAFIREKQFSSDASHELRTPLSVITIQAEEALHGEKTIAEYREALEQITFESKKMNKTITQLLMLTRGYEGKLTICREKFNLKTVIYDIVSEMEDFAISFGITLHYKQQEDIIIYADHMLITQMLINLIHNACKYGKPGGLVTINTAITDDLLRIVVDDNGIGISETDINHIFERFYRADPSHSGDGSGLGLSIVKWIVTAHSGNIEVASVFGEGTSIIITIPDQI